MSYRNMNEFIIIAEANRDPNTSFTQHRQRKSLGGIDCVARVGTPILAPADCWIANTPDNGTGGNTITLTYDNAEYGVDQMMHLSRFVRAGHYRQGEVVGYSGDSAAPNNPHVHWHKLGKWYSDQWGSTNRYNPFHFFTPTEQKDNSDMFVFVPAGSGIFVASLTTGKRKGIDSQYHYDLLTRFKNNQGNDRMLEAELDIIAGYLSAIADDGDRAEIIKAIKAIAITPEAIKDAMSALNITATVDYEEFARYLGIRLAGGNLG